MNNLVASQAVLRLWIRQKATLVGQQYLQKYHRWNCRYVAKISRENRINFHDPEDAKKAGLIFPARAAILCHYLEPVPSPGLPS